MVYRGYSGFLDYIETHSWIVLRLGDINQVDRLSVLSHSVARAFAEIPLEAHGHELVCIFCLKCTLERIPEA